MAQTHEQLRSSEKCERGTAMESVSNFEGKVYCGIDFHKNTSTLCTLGFRGEEIEPLTTIRTERLVQYLSNRKDWKIGIEATGGVNEMAARLKDSGHEVVIINSNKFRGIGIGGKKTDERDARALAECLRLNFVPEVYQRSRFARELKSLIVSREMVVRSRVNMMNHIRGTLREYGITIPVGAENFYEQAGGKIKSLTQPLIAEGLTLMLTMIRDLRQQEETYENAIKTTVGEDSRFARLQTAPGVGILTAAMMIAVVDDIGRFKNAKEFASYLGLTPSVSASAEKRMMGSITRSGSEILRRYLIHGARAWMRYTPSGDRNREWAEKVKDRRGMNKALVALAHRMARVCFAMLRDGVGYKNMTEKNENTAA